MGLNPPFLSNSSLCLDVVTTPPKRLPAKIKASMKKFTVDPVPTPRKQPSLIYFTAANAAFFFLSLSYYPDNIIYKIKNEKKKNQIRLSKMHGVLL